MNLSRIMVVDDSNTSRMIIKRCFQMAGESDIEFVEAEDGLDALTLLETEKVDLVVSDIKMPKMDGTTFIKKIRNHDSIKDLPVLVISSLGNEALEEELSAFNIEGILKKPLSPQKVSEFLEKMK